MYVRAYNKLTPLYKTNNKSHEQYKSKEEEERGEKHAARGPHVANTVAGIVLARRCRGCAGVVRVGTVENLNPFNIVFCEFHLSRFRRDSRVHDSFFDGGVSETQQMAYLVHRHGFQVHGVGHGGLGDVAGGHPVLRLVEVEHPVRRRERVRQRPQHSVERFTIPVVPTIKPYPDIRNRIRRRFGERDCGNLCPSLKRVTENALHSVVKAVVRVKCVGQFFRTLRPPRHAIEERVVRHRVELRRARGVRLTGVHCRGAVDYVGHAAARANDLLHRSVVELAGDVEVEILLVGLDGGFERIVEVVGEVRRRHGGDVAEVVEVVFEIGKAVIGFPATASGEVEIRVPRSGWWHVRGVPLWD